MAGLDGRILVIGLPTIAHQLHASTEEVIWIGQAYLLAGTVGLLLVGRIADQFGRVKMYRSRLRNLHDWFCTLRARAGFDPANWIPSDPGSGIRAADH